MGLRDKDKWDPLPKDQLNTKPRFHEKKVTVLLDFVKMRGGEDPVQFFFTFSLVHF